MKTLRICPLPPVWNSIYQNLCKFHAKNCPTAPPPPVPLILAGWAFSNDGEKTTRWLDTQNWATTHGALHLLPELSESDFYGTCTGSSGPDL
jgi:hypothetical protein